MQIFSKILGVGGYVPPQVLTNFDLEEKLNTSDEWIRQRTGIEQRHWVTAEMCTTDLALEATKEALKEAELEAKDIDMIIFATLSADHEFPGNGCFLQAKLGIEGIPAIDIRQQCTGYIYAQSMADLYIKSGQYNKVLVVGAEVHSKGMDKTPEGRDVSVLFGDGAGAVIFGASQEEGSSEVHKSFLHANGHYARELWIPAPGNNLGTEERLAPEHLEKKLQYPQMNGRVVFTHAVKKMSETLTQCLQSQNKTVADVDLFLFHQANLRINQKVAEVMGIPEEKIFNTIQKYGNTTAATIPLGMRDALKAGVLRRGMTVGMAAFGSGFTWGSSLLTF